MKEENYRKNFSTLYPAHIKVALFFPPTMSVHPTFPPWQCTFFLRMRFDNALWDNEMVQKIGYCIAADNALFTFCRSNNALFVSLTMHFLLFVGDNALFASLTMNFLFSDNALFINALFQQCTFPNENSWQCTFPIAKLFDNALFKMQISWHCTFQNAWIVAKWLNMLEF